ncbi:hypothetical protein BC829DRAFT_420316 [Chytridium lagenaria]|nr:hypothetical protein BC829DRAFT_420316 [Chytridium lagenaria]
MDSKNVIDVDDGHRSVHNPLLRCQHLQHLSTNTIVENRLKFLIPLRTPRVSKSHLVLLIHPKIGLDYINRPTWTRPSLSDIQKTTAEIEMTHSKATLAAHELESDGPEGSRHSGKKRRASAAKIKAKHGGGERSSVAKSEAGLPEVTISHGHVPRKGKGSSKMGKSRDHSPNGSVQQLKSSSSAEKPGKDGGADEKENKALRIFLTGLENPMCRLLRRHPICR